MRWVDPTGLYRTDYWNMSDDEVEESREIRDKIDNGGYVPDKKDRDKGGSEKPKEETGPNQPKVANFGEPVNPQIIPGTELPEDVKEIFEDLGIPLVEGKTPTSEELEQALSSKKDLTMDDIKQLVNDALKELKDLDPEVKEKIEGGLMMAAGIGISGGSLVLAAVAPVPVAASGFTTGAGIFAYGLSRYMNAGNNNSSMADDFVSAFTPPMSEFSRLNYQDIR